MTTTNEQEIFRDWCRSTLNKAAPAPADHPFLLGHGINIGELKVSTDNCLMLPLQDTVGTLHGLCLIDPDGSEEFKTDTGDLTGYFTGLGEPGGNTVLLCEKCHTGLKAFQQTKYPTLITFDPDNLVHVAELIKSQFPRLNVVIICDDPSDMEPGSPAREAAQVVKAGLLAMLPDGGDHAK